jgi:hypothetical protein
VPCCHCTKTWELYKEDYKTPTAWKQHVDIHHGEFPADKGAERAMITEIRKNVTGVQTETPWTKAAAFGKSGRPQGVSFSAVYRRLLAEFIV